MLLFYGLTFPLPAGRLAGLVLLWLCLSLPVFAQGSKPGISTLQVAQVTYRSSQGNLVDTLKVHFELTHPEQVSSIKIYFGNISPDDCQAEDVSAELWYNHRIAKYVLSNLVDFDKPVYTTLQGKKMLVPIRFRDMRLKWKEVNYVLVVLTDKQGQVSYQYYKNSRELMDKYCR